MYDKQQVLNQVQQFVLTHHAADFSGHDFEHVKRVVNLARKILVTEPSADAYIVELAAWLHDVDDYKQGNGETNNAEKLLQDLAVDPSVIRQVITVIDSIGFSKTGYNPQLPSLEAKILYDADKLDAIGAIGVARTLAYGGNKCRPLFLPDVFPPDELDLVAYAKNSVSGNNHTMIHFFEKLLKLAGLMQTMLGKHLAQERQKAMLNFLEAFFSEQDVAKWQQFLEPYKKAI